MPANTTPFEIIAAPFTIWIAPVAEAFPDLDTDPPGGNWTKVGTNGDLNYSDAGVTISHAQSMNFWRALGDAGSRKVFRQEEDLMIRVEMVDVSLEGYTEALHRQTPADVAAGSGTVGYKTIGLSRGLSVPTTALLVRGPSPYLDGEFSQYEVPIAAQSGSPEPVYRRDEPAMLALEWTALVDTGAANEFERFGRLRAADAAALP